MLLTLVSLTWKPAYSTSTVNKAAAETRTIISCKWLNDIGFNHWHQRTKSACINTCIWRGQGMDGRTDRRTVGWALDRTEYSYIPLHFSLTGDNNELDLKTCLLLYIPLVCKKFVTTGSVFHFIFPCYTTKYCKSLGTYWSN